MRKDQVTDKLNRARETLDLFAGLYRTLNETRIRENQFPGYAEEGFISSRVPDAILKDFPKIPRALNDYLNPIRLDQVQIERRVYNFIDFVDQIIGPKIHPKSYYNTQEPYSIVIDRLLKCGWYNKDTTLGFVIPENMHKQNIRKRYLTVISPEWISFAVFKYLPLFKVNDGI